MSPASPCTGVCEMDRKTGLCRGCRRTLDEIACWSKATDEEKNAILEVLQVRMNPVSGKAGRP